MTRRGSIPYKNDEAFMKYHNLSEPLRNGPDYGEQGNVNSDLEKLQNDDAKKINSIVNRIVSAETEKPDQMIFNSRRGIVEIASTNKRILSDLLVIFKRYFNAYKDFWQRRIKTTPYGYYVAEFVYEPEYVDQEADEYAEPNLAGEFPTFGEVKKVALKFRGDIQFVYDNKKTASISRKAGLYDRLRQDLLKHGPRLMLTLMGDACESISDELYRNGQLEESKAWDKNIKLMYDMAKKVKYG